MNLRQFLTALRKTKREWHTSQMGYLRCGGHCAVTRVALDAGAPGVHDAGDGSHAGVCLQLRLKTVTNIMDASDQEWNEDLASLRRALLRACGVAP